MGSGEAVGGEHGHIVHKTLPPAVREQLGHSHTLELVRVSDPTKRAQLANAAITQEMTVRQFRDPVGAAKANIWYDTDDQTPGVQPKTPPVPPVYVPQPGRLVTQVQKWVGDARILSAGWAALDPTKVRPAQRAGLKQAIAALSAELAALEAKLGE